MANKYVQLTVTGTYASKNNWVYEATGNTVSGWTEYMYYDDDYNKEYIYINGSSVRAASTSFTKATTTPSVNFSASIKRYPEPNLDIFQNSTGYVSQIYTNSSAITSPTYITLSISQQGTYAIAVNNSAATGVISLLNSTQSNICTSATITNGKQGFAVTMYAGTYYIQVSVNGSTAVNLPASSLKVVKLNDNLCINNGMWLWLNPLYAIDVDTSSEHYVAGLSFGSPASDYMSTGNSYEILPTGTSLDPAMNPLVPSTTIVTNKLHNLKEYFYCPTTYQVYIFHYNLRPDTIGAVTSAQSLTITDSISKLSTTLSAPGYHYYYYDIGVTLLSLRVPAQASVTVPTASSTGYIIQASTTTSWYNPLGIAQRSSVTLHSVEGSNSTVSKPLNGFMFTSPLPSLSSKATYFSIEMALKNASGRILRFKPVAGTVYMNVNGITFSFSLSTSNWTSYTSTSNSQRLIWRTSTGYKTVPYVLDYLLQSGSYIKITSAQYTVYGASATSTTSSYNGTYYIGRGTVTAGGSTFTITEYEDVSNQRVGFKILSGF